MILKKKRFLGPLGSARVSATNLRAPVRVPTSRPNEEPVFVKPEPVRKTSGIARPTGLARPSASRLPAPRYSVILSLKGDTIITYLNRIKKLDEIKI